MTSDDAEFPQRPEIVCLCGSSRFVREIAAANAELSLAGAIVLAPGVPSRRDGSRLELTAAQRAALGELHLRKIDLADRVVVVNPDGCIGESTRREIEYARATGVPVEYLFEGDEETGAVRVSAHGTPVRMFWDYVFVLEWADEVADSFSHDVTDELPGDLVARAKAWGARMSEVFGWTDLGDAPPIPAAEKAALESEYDEIRASIEALGYTLTRDDRWPFQLPEG